MASVASCLACAYSLKAGIGGKFGRGGSSKLLLFRRPSWPENRAFKMSDLTATIADEAIE
jgi:hypothetical protein